MPPAAGMAAAGPGKPSSMVTPFTIDIPQRALDDLHDRLLRVRWPSGLPDEEDIGLGQAYLRELVDHWRNGYDWRSSEVALNRLPQVLVAAGGVRIHAVHAPGRGPRPLPLLLSHGWPSTFAEFAGVVGPLTDPGAHGADPADAFHVVVPSLPGYGFSEPLPAGQTRRVTEVWCELMAALGYRRFAAHGGDIGAFVTTRLAIEYPERLVGVHTGFPAEPPADLTDADLTEEERRFLRRRRLDREAGGAYAHAQRTRPLTVAYGLSDSPAGLAAWILDKWRDWSDCDGDLCTRFTPDQLLTVVSLYWLTGTIASSFRFYREWGLGTEPGLAHRYPHSPPGVDTHRLPPGERVRVPAAVALFKADYPRRYVERAYTDLRRLTTMPRGGHFPAMEEPGLLVEDLRAFFRPLRGG
jgi:pimeloyl-ACP methyl ester carboxylesterase